MSTRKKSELVSKIRGLREHEPKQSQEQFAKELGVTRVAVIHWETGRSEPGTAQYVGLAGLAQKKVADAGLARWFLEQTNISDETLRMLVPAIDEKIREYERRQRADAKRANSLSVSIVDPARIKSASVSSLYESEGFVNVPDYWFPNNSASGSIFCIPGTKKHGLDLIFIDTSQRDATALAKAEAPALVYLARYGEESAGIVYGRMYMHRERGATTETPAIGMDWEVYRHIDSSELSVEVQTADVRSGERGSIESRSDRQQLREAGRSILIPLSEPGDGVIGKAVLRVVEPSGGVQGGGMSRWRSR